jgi:hypothetical protein
MRIIFNLFCLFFLLFILTNCRSNSNKKAVNAEDLDRIMAEEARNAPAGPTRNNLSATELIEVSNCYDAACVQLFMKNLMTDFVHAKKGEFASLIRSAIKDTMGQELIMPVSTLYFSTDPGADWRMAHTVHKSEISNQLLNEFIAKGFVLQDSGYYTPAKAVAYHYTSSQYPGKVLYFFATYKPWGSKGMYLGANWASFVFEVLTAQ